MAAMLEQFNIIPMGQNVHSNAKHFHCSWHATWPPCKTSIIIIELLFIIYGAVEKIYGLYAGLGLYMQYYTFEL